MAKRALVVDNDFFFVAFLSELLEDRGYEVVKANDGKEGISKLKEGPFDLVFVDLIMPKIDGKQFIRFVRGRYADAGFPIVVMSATLIEQMDKIEEIGGDYYLAKGPMETMEEHLNTLIDNAEKQPFPDQDSDIFFGLDRLYPRLMTSELIENINFQTAILESIGMGIMVIDKDAEIIGANSLALEITGKPLEKVLNRSITRLFPPEDKTRLIKTLHKIIDNQTLKRLILTTSINAREIRVIISVLRVNGEVGGWIMAMVEHREGDS